MATLAVPGLTQSVRFGAAWLRGRTLLMSTHRPQLLEWVDAIAVIEGGQCLAFGPKQEMLEKLTRGIDVQAPRTAAA